MKNFEVQNKVFVLILLLEVWISIEVSEAKEISCEKVNYMNWWTFVGTVKTCFMDKTTTIDEPEATISKRDESIKGLEFSKNKNIFHLPDNVAGSFPNLEEYNADFCSLIEITKRNFNGLVRLKELSLYKNQIENIADDTFEGLVALENLWLGKKNQFMFSQFLSQLFLQLTTKSSS